MGSIKFNVVFNVALLGLDSLFGQISSLLLKQSCFIRKLVLYDEHNIEKAKDIAIVNSNCAVEAFVGKEKLNDAVKGADVIIIGDGSLSTPHTCFDLMAPRICDYAKAIANNSPNAIVLVAASPVNILVPLISECLKEQGVLDPKKIIGATAVDNARANCLLASILRVSPDKVTLPVVGGASKESKVPLISQAKPSTSLPLDVMKNLISDIRNFDNYIFTQKKIPEALNKAYATVQFVTSIFQGLRGQLNIVKIGFSKTSLISDTEYFSLPLQLGICGIQKAYGLPELFPFEKELLASSINAINRDVELAKNFYRTMDSPMQLVNANLNNKKSDGKKIEVKSPILIKSKGKNINKFQSLSSLYVNNIDNKSNEFGKLENKVETNTKVTKKTECLISSNEFLPLLGSSRNLDGSILNDKFKMSKTSRQNLSAKPSGISNQQHKSNDFLNEKLDDIGRIGITQASTENSLLTLKSEGSLQKEKSRHNLSEIKPQVYFTKGKYNDKMFKTHENLLLNSFSVSNEKEFLIEKLFQDLQNKKKHNGKHLKPVEKKVKNKIDILLAEPKELKEDIHDESDEKDKRNYISKKELMESLIKKVANQTIEEEQNQIILNEKRIQSIIVNKLNEDEKENEDKLTDLLKLNKSLSEKKSKTIINKLDQTRKKFFAEDLIMSKIDTNGIQLSNTITPLTSLIEKNKSFTEWKISQNVTSDKTQWNKAEHKNSIDEAKFPISLPNESIKKKFIPNIATMDYVDKSKKNKLIYEVNVPKAPPDDLMKNINEIKLMPNSIEKNIFASELKRPVRPNEELNKITMSSTIKESNKTNKLINKVKWPTTSQNEPNIDIYESKLISNIVAQSDVKEERNLLNEAKSQIVTNTEKNKILLCNVNYNENSKLINEIKNPLNLPYKQQKINLESKSIPSLVSKWDINGKNSLTNEIRSLCQENEETKIVEQSINQNSASNIKSSVPSFNNQKKPIMELKCPIMSTNDVIKSYLREAVERDKESKEEEMFFKFDTKELEVSEMQKQRRSSTAEPEHSPHYNDMWSLSKKKAAKKLKNIEQKNESKLNNKSTENCEIKKNKKCLKAGLEKTYESYFKHREFENNYTTGESKTVHIKSIERNSAPKKNIISPVTTSNTVPNEDILNLAFSLCGQLEKINSINPNDLKSEPHEIKRKYNPNIKTEEQAKILDETSAEKTMHYLKRRNEILKNYYGNNKKTTENNVALDLKSNNDDAIDYVISDLFKEVHNENVLFEGKHNEILQNNNIESNENLNDKNHIELKKNINDIKETNNELFKNINNIKINNEELMKTINDINSDCKRNGNEIDSHEFEIAANKDNVTKITTELQNDKNEIKSYNFELMGNKYSMEKNNYEMKNNKIEMKLNNNELSNKHNGINNAMKNNKNDKSCTNDDEINKTIEKATDHESKSHNNETMSSNSEFQNAINKVANINSELTEKKTNNSHFGLNKVPTNLKSNYYEKNVGPHLLKRSDNNNQFPRKDPPKQLCKHSRDHSSSSGFETSHLEQTSSSNLPVENFTFLSSSNEWNAECPHNQNNLACQLASSKRLKRANFEKDSVFYERLEKIDVDKIVEEDDKLFFKHLQDYDEGEKSFNISDLINYKKKENNYQNNILENKYDENNRNKPRFNIEHQSYNDENISHTSDDSKIIYKKYRVVEPEVESEEEKNYHAFISRMNEYDVFPCTEKENYLVLTFPVPNKKLTENKSVRLNEENMHLEALYNKTNHEESKSNLQNTKENACTHEQESVESEKSNIIFTKASGKNIQKFSLKKSSLPRVEESNSKSSNLKPLNTNYNNKSSIRLPYNINNIIQSKKEVGDKSFDSLLKLRMNINKKITKLRKLGRSDLTRDNRICFTHNSIHANFNKNKQKVIKNKTYDYNEQVRKAESYMVGSLGKNPVLSASKGNYSEGKNKKINKPAHYSTSSLSSRFMSPSRRAVNIIKEKALKKAMFKKTIPTNKSGSNQNDKNKSNTLLNFVGQNSEKNSRNLPRKKKPYGNEVINCFYKQKIPCQKDADDYYENTRCTFKKRAEEIEKEDSHIAIIPRKNTSLNINKISKNYKLTTKPDILQSSSTIHSKLKSNMEVKINGPCINDSSSYYLFRKKFMNRNKIHYKEHYRPFSSGIQENLSSKLENIYKPFTKVSGQCEYSRGLKMPTMEILLKNSINLPSK